MTTGNWDAKKKMNKHRECKLYIDAFPLLLWTGLELTSTYVRGFIRSQLLAVNAAYVASHRQLLNLTFKKVVVVISSTETGRNNYESLYFIL